MVQSPIIILLIILALIVGYLKKDSMRNLTKIIIEQVKLIRNPQEFIQSIKDNLQKFIEKSSYPILPQQTEKPKEKQYQFIIQHHDKFLVVSNIDSNLTIRCENREILYIYSENTKNFYSQTGEGFQYKVTYDKNYNPNYELYEGRFLNGKRHGQGKLFGQKSENVIFQGEWINGELLLNQNNESIDDQQFLQQSLQQKSGIIVIRDGDKIIKQGVNYNKRQSNIEVWIKFNQQISQNDIDILQNHKRWFTSSIIDSFALFLNIEMEEQYFKIDFNHRKQVLRQTFVPSQIFTQMRLDSKGINIKIFQNHFLEYKRINYQLEKLFNRINFIINRNNNHWFLLQLKLSNYELIIMDSIKNKVESYNFVKDILNTIFDNKIKKITISDQSQQQKNAYDCGPLTCLHMLQISDITLKIENPTQMRKFLLEKLQQIN